MRPTKLVTKNSSDNVKKLRKFVTSYYCLCNIAASRKVAYTDDTKTL